MKTPDHMPLSATLTDDDLYQELARRHAGTVVVTVKRIQPAHDKFEIWYDGGIYLARGLLESASESIVQTIDGGGDAPS
jgi:hypothetical protein